MKKIPVPEIILSPETKLFLQESYEISTLWDNSYNKTNDLYKCPLTGHYFDHTYILASTSLIYQQILVAGVVQSILDLNTSMSISFDFNHYPCVYVKSLRKTISQSKSILKGKLDQCLASQAPSWEKENCKALAKIMDDALNDGLIALKNHQGAWFKYGLN